MVQRMLELGEGALSLPGRPEAERSQLAAQMHSSKQRVHRGRDTPGPAGPAA